MRKPSRFVLLVVGLIVLGSSSCSREKKEVLTPNPWTRFNPGSWVVLRTIMTVTGQGENKSKESEQKLTLVEVTDDKVVLEEDVGTGKDGATAVKRIEAPRNLPPPSKGKQSDLTTHPALAAAVAAAAEMQTVTDKGEETLEIGGCQVAAKWTQYGGGAAMKKVWSSPDVPGPYCKVEMWMQIGELTQTMRVEVTAFEKK